MLNKQTNRYKRHCPRITGYKTQTDFQNNKTKQNWKKASYWHK